MASRLLRGTGHSGAEGTGQSLGDSFAHWALPRHRPAPGEWLMGGKGRGLSAELDASGHMELQAQGTGGGRGAGQAQAQGSFRYLAGRGCLKPETPKAGVTVGASAWGHRPHPNGPMTTASSQDVPRPGLEVCPWADTTLRPHRCGWLSPRAMTAWRPISSPALLSSAPCPPGVCAPH